jgi:hypothetical protein
MNFCCDSCRAIGALIVAILSRRSRTHGSDLRVDRFLGLIRMTFFVILSRWTSLSVNEIWSRVESCDES